jgi:hypothetical protein
MGVVTYAITRQDLVGCASASSVHWIINSVAGGIGLLLFAGQRYWWHWLILPIITAAGLVLTLSLPDECKAVPAMSLVVTVVYMSAALFLMTVLFREFDRRRSEGLLLWASSVEYQAEIERQITVTSQWSRVSASTVALLSGIADGSLDVADARIRERAASEESQLRGNLGVERRSTSSLWRAVLEAVEVGASRGLSVDAAIISMPRDAEPIPREVSDLLDAVVTQSPSRTVKMRIFVDQGLAEVLVTAPFASIDAAWANLSRPRPVKQELGPETIVIGSVVLTKTPTGDRKSLLSIRRGAGA